MLCVSYKETPSINDVEGGWMADVEHVFNEIVECVGRMREIDRGQIDSGLLADAFSELVGKCTEFSVELVDAKDDERRLLEWKALLVESNESFGKAGGQPTAADGRKIAAMNGEIGTCMKLISEMLYILNPHTHPPAAARGIGVRQGRMPEMAEMRTLLGRL